MDNSFSVTWLPAHPYTGSVSMQRYWHEIHRVAEDLGLNVECPFRPSNIIQEFGRLKRARGIYLDYPFKAARVSTKVVHILDHSSAHLIPYIPSSVKIVVSVHDLFPLVDSADMTPFQHWRLCRRLKLLKRADMILPISNYTKQQLTDLLSISPDKTCMMHLGYTALSEGKKYEAIPGIPERNKKSIFILSVGNYSKRKNLEILPEVLKELLRMKYAPVLIRAGDLLPFELSTSVKDAVGGGNFIEFGRVEDSVLNSLYSKSDLLFIPSWAEGFGLPLLEAMGKGCPVVSSNTTSLPEVGGEAVLYFNPDNPVEASERIVALLSPDVRARYIQAGYEQVKKFSWNRYVTKLLEIYKSLDCCAD